MCGPAGAGKSTYAQHLEEAGWVRLSIDVEAWRQGYVEAPLPMEVARAIRADQLVELGEHVRAGRDVVVDYSFWSREHRREYAAFVERLGGTVEIVYLKVSREELFRRVARRNAQPAGPHRFRVDEELLGRYVDGFEEPDADEGLVRTVIVG